jgi:hypothetical protein
LVGSSNTQNTPCGHGAGSLSRRAIFVSYKPDFIASGIADYLGGVDGCFVPLAEVLLLLSIEFSTPGILSLRKTPSVPTIFFPSNLKTLAMLAAIFTAVAISHEQRIRGAQGSVNPTYTRRQFYELLFVKLGML